jgi:hypothetical protein
MAPVVERVPILHVRFEGKSFDLPLTELDVGIGSNDAEIKRAVAVHLRVSENRLRFYVIDRHPTGNLTLRPEAVFG